MKAGVQCIAWAVLMVCLNGCVRPFRYSPLTEEKFPASSTVRIFGNVSQDRVKAWVKPESISSFAGGGLIFSAIGESVTAVRVAKMERIVKPINDEMEGFDFRNALEKALRESTISQLTPHATVAGVVAVLGAHERKRFFAKNPEDAILQIETAYSLTVDYKRLIVGTTVYLWGRGNRTPIFYNNYGYHTPPVGESSVPAEIIKLWSENGAEKMRLSLAEGIAETIRMINRDLARKTDTVIATRTPPLWVIPSQNKLTNPCYLERNGNRYIIRATNGVLLSLSSDDTF